MPVTRAIMHQAHSLAQMDKMLKGSQIQNRTGLVLHSQIHTRMLKMQNITLIMRTIQTVPIKSSVNETLKKSCVMQAQMMHMTIFHEKVIKMIFLKNSLRKLLKMMMMT